MSSLAFWSVGALSLSLAVARIPRRAAGPPSKGKPDRQKRNRPNQPTNFGTRPGWLWSLICPPNHGSCRSPSVVRIPRPSGREVAAPKP